MRIVTNSDHYLIGVPWLCHFHSYKNTTFIYLQISRFLSSLTVPNQFDRSYPLSRFTVAVQVGSCIQFGSCYPVLTVAIQLLSSLAVAVQFGSCYPVWQLLSSLAVAIQF